MSELGGDAPRARVIVTPRSLRSLRVSMQLTRWIVYAVALAGIAATVRFAVAPPQPRPARSEPAARADAAAQGYATLFARRYLTWDASRPDAYAAGLSSFLGDAVDATAGQRLPTSGSQSVEWAQVVQSRPIAARASAYTVAAQTDTGGLVYLSIEVARDASGALTLAGYPAFVGAPASDPARTLTRDNAGDVSEPALIGVVTRTLRNYLAGSGSNLAADLTAGARVTLPATRLVLRQLTALQWRPDRSGVIATVVADDARGAGYTLAYEIDVQAAAGRWEVAAIQTDPTS